MRRWIMHVDMDAFYASVEQLDNEAYRGRPVIVGGLSSRGVVSTASYEARKFGVHSAMGMAKARKLCPDGIYVWPRMERYKEISRHIHTIMERFTPYIEPLSLDEAFLEVTGMEGLYPNPKALAAEIKRQVKEETGLTISAGIAPNKFLAKIASDLRKPDGLVVVPYGGEAAFLADLPIRRLWGVGKQLAARLEAGGFFKVGDIASLPSAQGLIPYCGQQAQKMYELSKGIDNRPVEYEREAQSIGNEETYETDVTDTTFIDREWRYFAHRVAKRLRKSGVMGSTVSIKVRFDDFSTVTRQKTLDVATDDEDVLYEQAILLYKKVKERKPIRLLGLTVSHLQTPVVQESLFEDHEPKSKLTETLDALEKKFGNEVVTKGALWERGQRYGDYRTYVTLTADEDGNKDGNKKESSKRGLALPQKDKK